MFSDDGDSSWIRKGGSLKRVVPRLTNFRGNFITSRILHSVSFALVPHHLNHSETLTLEWIKGQIERIEQLAPSPRAGVQFAGYRRRVALNSQVNSFLELYWNGRGT